MKKRVDHLSAVMFESGADIRYIPEMLGHAKVYTTQIYTQVSIRRLKEIHTATHPAKSDDVTDQERENDGRETYYL